MYFLKQKNDKIEEKFDKKRVMIASFVFVQIANLFNHAFLAKKLYVSQNKKEMK